MAEKKPAAKEAAAKTEKTGGARKVPFGTKVKNFFGRIVKYFKDTKSELKKVVWPSKKQIKTNTFTVIVVVLIAAVTLIVLDLIFGGIVGLMIG